jgi:hypothetical protein
VARRPQRRRPFRLPRGAKPDTTREDQAIEAAARRLAGVHDPHSLESLVSDLRQLRDDADRAATDQPSPDALRTYRRASRELAEAQRALTLVGGQN